MNDAPTVLARALDALVAMAQEGRDTFADMARVAGLDPATDFVGSDLSGVDFRDEDLAGFRFCEADLTGCDFRRSTGLTDEAFDGAMVRGAIGLPPSVADRVGPDGVVAPMEPPPAP